MANFKFVLSIDKEFATFKTWLEVKAALVKLFNEQLGGLKPIIEEELPLEDINEDRVVERRG